jgi:D-amino-acid dehydrogenase
VSQRADHVAVIGGGVIGAMCAWNLVQAGCRVTIVDRDKFGAACSHGNCGYVSPSHVLPLTQPGAIGKTMKAMMSRNSPFSVKPRFSSSFARWFWNFSRRCNRRDMLEAAVGRHALLQSSQRLYKQLIADENIDCEWQEVGLLFVFDTEEEFSRYKLTDDLLRNEFGVGATPYPSAELTTLEPALKSGFGGAWHYEDDCHLRPDKLLSAMRARLGANGVQFVEDWTVDEFIRENGRARAIVGQGKHIEADQYVVATGALTPFLNKHLGCRIPIEPGKGYSLTMPTPARMPKIPMIFETSHVAITPMKSKYRIGSTMEFVGYDTSISAKRINLLKTAAAKYLHEPFCEPIEEEWFGWRPMTWDGKPIIDRSPAMNNVWIAAGHNMLGLSMSTGTGRLVRELILGEEPHIDPAHFALARLT